MRILNPGVVSVWGIAGVGKSAQTRHKYYKYMLDLSKIHGSKTYCWVDVPQPFCLIELSRRLLLDFNSDDIQAKETMAISIIEGKDPIQLCRDLLRRHIECSLIVLDGLQSMNDWDSLKAAFGWPELSCCNGKLVVVTNEQSVARHCVGNNNRNVFNVKGLSDDDALHLFSQKVHIVPACPN